MNLDTEFNREMLPPTTTLRDHLGQNFDNFEESFVRKVTTKPHTPYDRVKVALVALSFDDKTQLVREIFRVLGENERIRQFKEETGFVHTIWHYSLGERLNFGRSIIDSETKRPLLESVQGYITPEEYKRCSENGARVQAIAKSIPRKEKEIVIDVVESIAGTAIIDEGRIIGVDRDLSLLLQWVDDQTDILFPIASRRLIHKAARVRELMKCAPIENIPLILAKEGIIDNRTPEQIKAAAQKAGDKRTRWEQENDIYQIMYSLIKTNKMDQPPFSVDSPQSFRKYPTQTLKFMEEYWQYWITACFGWTTNRRSYFLPHDLISQKQKLEVGGEEITHASYTRQLERVISDPIYAYLKPTLASLGVTL